MNGHYWSHIAFPFTGGGGRNPEVDFHGEKRLNQTHASTIDPEARLFRKGKGKEAKLCFMGHVLMLNRHGLVISPRLTATTGTAEREAAEAMVEGVPGRHRITVGGDKAYDTRGFVQAMRGPKAVPHVAQNCQGRKSALTAAPPAIRGTPPVSACGKEARLGKGLPLLSLLKRSSMLVDFRCLWCCSGS